MIENRKLKFLFQICIVTAIIFAVCFYNNQTGIACTIFAVFIACLFWWLIRKKRRGRIGFHHLFYGIALILLGLVPALFDNVFLLIVSKMLSMVIMIKWVITIYYNVEKIEFVRNIIMIFSFLLEATAGLLSPFTDIGQIMREDSDDGEKTGYDTLTEKDTANKANEEYRKENTAIKSGHIKHIFMGIVISVPVLIIIVSLLASADVVFRNMLFNLFRGVDNIGIMIKWLITAFVGFLAAYGCGKALLNGRIKISNVEINKTDTVIGITFTGIISAVYLLFCGIQIAALFNTGGNMLPDGYTYAKYARSGFFQLLFVCMINVCMVLICRLKFRMSRTLRKLLTLISGCTYIMTASSAYRMMLYIKNYNLTFLRVLVLWALLVIAVLMVFVIWFIYNEDIKLFEYSLMSVTVLFLAFACMNPDNLIAKYNLRYDTGETKDICYLTDELSMDAADAVISDKMTGDFADEVIRYCKKVVLRYESEYKGDIRKYNYSRYQAYKKAKRFLN